MSPRIFFPTRVLALSCIVILLSACSGLKIKNMVPASVGNVSKHHDKSISIGAVSGNQKEFFGGPELITAEEFQAVLKETFVRSKLFSVAGTASNADWEMTAKFLAHGQVSKGLIPETAMVIEYRIVNLRTGQEVWKEAFNSRNTATLGDALGGAKRTRLAQEGCVRKNVEQLVEALNKLSIE